MEVGDVANASKQKQCIHIDCISLRYRPLAPNAFASPVYAHLQALCKTRKDQSRGNKAAGRSNISSQLRLGSGAISDLEWGMCSLGQHY